MSWVSLRHTEAVTQEIQVSCLYGIGLNYADHAQEMGAQRPAEPVVFIKPVSALMPGGGELAYPRQTTALHHEVEIVLLLGQDGFELDLAAAQERILGVAIGLDLTLRDRQQEAKQAGRPWATAKGFAGSAPVSTFLPVEEMDLNALDFSLHVNGELRQQGKSSDMLFSAAELVMHLSQYFQLCRGDLIFTGTPAGVGPLFPGDQLEAVLGSLHLPLQIKA